MTPIYWALLPLKRYLDFTGRSPRAEYWWYALTVTIAGGLLGFIDGFALRWPIYGGLGVLGLAFTAATIVPGIAVLVRRLHDSDVSGWWALVRIPTYLIIATGSSYGSVGTVVGRTSGVLFVVEILAIIGWFFAALYVFVRMVNAGDAGPNSYGPDPYGGHDELEEVFA